METGNSISNLTTEKRNSRTMDLDEMTPEEILCVMNDEDENAVRAVRQAIPDILSAVKLTSVSLEKGGRIIYLGAGTSGRLGVLDAVECPPTFGVDDNTVVGLIAGGKTAFVKAVEGAEDNRELAREDLIKHELTEKDTLIAITASGRTPYCIGGLLYADEVGCSRVSIACNKESEISQYADVAIELDTGPEILSGSTRLKAGTAEKMTLNMISTVSMISIGKVYANLMVDVKPTNEKLRVRAENICIQATGCTKEEARKELALTNGDTKLAIVHILTGGDINAARKKLSVANGKVRLALRL